MALPFPDVPNLPGVPQVPRLPGAVASAGLTIASGAISALLGGAARRPNLWGIFDSNNKSVLSPDSMLEFSHRKDFQISDFPVVAGSFANYNKVEEPFQIQIRVSRGGTLDDRTELLKQAQALANSTQLYTIRTPERTYKNCNLEHYEVSRNDAKDAFFLTRVELTFVEIRQVTAQYGDTPTFLLGISPYSPAAAGDFNFSLENALSPAALPTVNQGNVQPQPATGQAASIGQSALSTAAANPITR